MSQPSTQRLMRIWRQYRAGLATADEVVSAWIEATRWVGNSGADKARGLAMMADTGRFEAYLRSWCPDTTTGGEA